ncbi:MAG TPA: superoxide dismutase family protein, partial [Woeseiaceae bacterium]|nr:superoxide dismutase family protein [Woeseiaceae bacterium]
EAGPPPTMREPDQGTAGGAAVASAEAEILPTEEQTTGGRITLTREGNQVRIQGTVTGLTPGEHGFHIHEKGDCSASDASSAGGHFAPQHHPHGSPQDPPEQHHVGDLGNITAGNNGEAGVDVTSSLIRLSGPDSVIDKAIIVHGGKDDFESQPSGNSGPRVGCGVIRTVDDAQASTTV